WKYQKLTTKVPNERSSLETLSGNLQRQDLKTRTGYNGSLKLYIRRYSNVNYFLVHKDTNNVEEDDDSHNGNYADSFEEDNGNRERRSRSLVSMEYNSDYEKDNN
ncbi:16892_t:CDS:2, partial [Funneliformis caledonium]